MTKFWNFRNEQTDPQKAGAGEMAVSPDGELDIDGEIVAERGWFDEDGLCVARDFRAALSGYGNVTVRINSPGGDVMAGADIYSALREHSLNGKGRVKVIVTALAASAASVIAMAGDEILMSPTAYMMIHNPWSVAIGDAKEMRKTARTLDVISEGLINAYQIRTGKTRDELKRMLDNETWMSAYTCVEQGFADGMWGFEDGATAAARACLMSGRSHGAQEIAARIRAKAEDPEEDPEKKPEEEEARKATDPDESREEGGDPASEPEKDPEKKPGEEAEKDPEKDPEEDPEEDPEADPEEDPGEDPEEDPEEEKRKAMLDKRRQNFLAAAMLAWEESFFEEDNA